MDRRKFLRKASGAIIGGSALSQSVGAENPEDDEFRKLEVPSVVRGTRIHRFKRDGGKYRHSSEFVSQELRREYGAGSFATEEGTIDKRRAEMMRSSFEGSDLDSKDTSVDFGKVSFSIRYPDTAVIGEVGEHANVEKFMKKAVSDYLGPLYVYKADENNPEENDLVERTGPMNTGWRENIDKFAGDIERYMEDRGWTACCSGIPGDRYVIVNPNGDPYVSKQDAHVANTISFTKQYHIRLYNIPEGEDDSYRVVGQVHKDPYDHGFILDPNWHFEESRQKVSSAWQSWGYSTDAEDVNNGYRYGSSDGYLGTISD